jgi:hypothetical protein
VVSSPPTETRARAATAAMIRDKLMARIVTSGYLRAAGLPTAWYQR